MLELGQYHVTPMCIHRTDDGMYYSDLRKQLSRLQKDKNQWNFLGIGYYLKDINLLKIFRLFTDSRITSEKLVLTECSIYESQKRES